MRKLVLGLFLMGLAVSSVLGASVPGEKPIQFSLALSGGGFWPDTGDARTIIGPGARLDFNLGKWIILSVTTASSPGREGGSSIFGRTNRKSGPWPS